MLRTAGKILRDSTGLYAPGRAVEIFDDDMFIISYPKSGNTWVRFLIANLLAKEEQVDFSSIHQIIPDIYRSSKKMLRKCARPRILKSHEYFDPRYRKIIYVIRDPRDVVVSYFHHYNRRNCDNENRLSFGPYVERFLRGDLDVFGSWQENVGSWLGARLGREHFLPVRYEDVSIDPQRELGRMAGFLGLQVDARAVEQAVQRSSFEQMRELERFQAEIAKTLDASRIEHPFVRSGSVGGWKRELPEALAGRIEDAWGKTMADLGYLDAAPRTRGGVFASMP